MARSSLIDSDDGGARRGRAVGLPLPADAMMLAAALALLASDLVFELVRTTWQMEDHSYSPLIFVMGIGMAAVAGWRALSGNRGRSLVWAWVPLVLALLLFIAARAVSNPFTAYFALLIAAASSALLVGGWRALRRFALPLAALAFAAPLPGALVTSFTFPLKMWISRGAVGLLRMVNLPVARDGVLIEIGNYQLLVAEACSGLQSMFSLVAVAAFYSFVTAPMALRRASLLMAAALPIVFLLNIVRVVALALITVWFGNAAGEGFLHSVAGIAMFVLALLALAALDQMMPARGQAV